MKGYTTISVRPLQKAKLKALKDEEEETTYGDVLDQLFENAELEVETQKKFKELEEEYEDEN